MAKEMPCKHRFHQNCIKKWSDFKVFRLFTKSLIDNQVMWKQFQVG